MLALSILDIKTMMGKLLLSEMFDPFLFVEAEIVTFAAFRFDGRFRKEFFTAQELELSGKTDREFCTYSEIRNYCLELIKGKKTPLSFHFVLAATEEQIDRLFAEQAGMLKKQDVNGLYLNFNFDGTHLTATAGVSLSVFTMDKTAEQLWGLEISRFLKENGIASEIL